MSYKVPFVNYPEHYRRMWDETMAALTDVLSHGDLIMRAQMRQFEDSIAALCGSKYAVGLNSGTDAIWLSLVAAGIKPGDIAMVSGCGTIGLVTGLAAQAAGCSKVIITDIIAPKLEIAARYGMIPVNIKTQDLQDIVDKETCGWGVDEIFEASGNETAIAGIFILDHEWKRQPR